MDISDTNLCPICYQNFQTEGNIPLIVPCCGRSVCQRCIIFLLDKSRQVNLLICPFCKGRVPTNQSMQSFPKNHSLLDLLEVINEKNKFKQCEIHQKPIDILCKDCKEPICNFCLVKVHKGHQIELIEEFETNVKAKVQEIKQFIEKYQREKFNYEQIKSQAIKEQEKRVQDSFNVLEDRLYNFKLEGLDYGIECIKENNKLDMSQVTKIEQLMKQVQIYEQSESVSTGIELLSIPFDELNQLFMLDIEGMSVQTFLGDPLKMNQKLLSITDKFRSMNSNFTLGMLLAPIIYKYGKFYKEGEGIVMDFSQQNDVDVAEIYQEQHLKFKNSVMTEVKECRIVCPSYDQQNNLDQMILCARQVLQLCQNLNVLDIAIQSEENIGIFLEEICNFLQEKFPNVENNTMNYDFELQMIFLKSVHENKIGNVLSNFMKQTPENIKLTINLLYQPQGIQLMNFLIQENKNLPLAFTLRVNQSLEAEKINFSDLNNQIYSIQANRLFQLNINIESLQQNNAHEYVNCWQYCQSPLNINVIGNLNEEVLEGLNSKGFWNIKSGNQSDLKSIEFKRDIQTD